jgi:hypothetical protein
MYTVETGSGFVAYVQNIIAIGSSNNEIIR